MAERTQTVRLTRMLGQSVQIGEIIVTFTGLKGAMGSLTITAPEDAPILAPLDEHFVRKHRKLARNERGWLESVPR